MNRKTDKLFETNPARFKFPVAEFVRDEKKKRLQIDCSLFNPVNKQL